MVIGSSGSISDVRLAVRAAIRHPGTAAAIVATLAIGIGFATAIFSVVHAVVVAPLPYADSDQLVMVWNEFRATGLRRLPLSARQMLELRELAPFADAEGIWATRGTLAGDEPRQVSLGLVSSGFFALLGVEPAAGRLLAAGDEVDPTAPPVVISHRLWQEGFGGDPAVVGRTLRLEGVVATVVGVLPPGFRLLLPEDSGVPPELEVYRPLPWALAELPVDQYFLRVVGRLRPESGVGEAAVAVGAAAARLRQAFAPFAEADADLGVVGLQDDATAAVRPLFLVAATAAGLLLVLMLVNVTTLLVSRTLRQRHEIATRICLGGTRGRLLRQHLVESGLLTSGGALLGVALGAVGASLLWRHRPPGVSRVDAIALEPAVLVVALVAAVVAAGLCVLVPLRLVSWTRPRLDLGGRGGEGGRRGRLGPALLVGQLAVSTVLLVAALLLARSALALVRVDPGFAVEGLLTFKVSLPVERFSSAVERARLAAEVETALASLPGVAAAGATSHLPLDRWANWSWDVRAEGALPEEVLHVDHRAVTSGFLPALGARLVAGRSLDGRDTYDSAPVVVIDDILAARAFPGRHPIGLQLRVAAFRDGGFEERLTTVVGVVSALRDRSPGRPSDGQVFLPYAQCPRWELAYAVRTTGEPLALVTDARRAVVAVGHGLALADPRAMSAYAADATASARSMAGLIGLFAAVAVFLAALGLYGAVGAAVARRRRELALRQILGATADRLVRRLVAGVLGLSILGLGLGLPLAWASTRLLAGLLFGVSPVDPTTYVTVAALLVGTAFVAAVVPARRVLGISPAMAMQEE